jgi:hypothetical protein
MDLLCTHNINKAPEIKQGQMTYCRIFNSPHWFILVESGQYQENNFVPDNNIRAAFSYVPHHSYKYISKKYKKQKCFQFIKSPADTDLSTLSGYNPFYFTKSYVLDTWKLTDKYIAVKSKPICNWKYERFPEFKLYNVLYIFPYNGIVDCIGYSNYHYEKAGNT